MPFSVSRHGCLPLMAGMADAVLELWQEPALENKPTHSMVECNLGPSEIVCLYSPISISLPSVVLDSQNFS